MKVYQFQYAKTLEALFIVLGAIATVFVSEMLAIHIKVNLFLTLVLSFGLGFLLFFVLKEKAVHICTARLGETYVSFEFGNDIKTIDFKNLISYKFYNGRNGPILYLKSANENFKIAANNNFCKTDDFKSFCDDIVNELDEYKEQNNLRLIKEGSIYTKKGMLYFLIIATSIYLLAFFIETKQAKVIIGFIGGFYFFIMWTKVFIENKKSKEDLR